MTSACSNQCTVLELSLLDRRCTAPVSLVHLLCNLEITQVCLKTRKQTSWCVANTPTPCLVCWSPNISPETTYNDWCFPWISLVNPGEYCSSTSVSATTHCPSFSIQSAFLPASAVWFWSIITFFITVLKLFITMNK